MGSERAIRRGPLGPIVGTNASTATGHSIRRRSSSPRGRRPRQTSTGASAADGSDDRAAALDQLAAINRVTFPSRYHAVAYHSPAATLHVMEYLNERQRPAEIQALAHEQAGAINVVLPVEPALANGVDPSAMVPRRMSPAWQEVTGRDAGVVEQRKQPKGGN